MELALEAGADDVKHVGDKFEVTCDPDVFSARVRRASSKPASSPKSARSPASPRTPSISTPRPARKVLKLMEALDDHDDVQNVSANFNIPDEAMAEIEAG